MRDVLDDLYERWSRGEEVGVATVIATSSSAPRPPGTTMIVAADGTVSGSISGGCVEAAVYELALQTLADGVPVRQRFGIADSDAFAVGLTCGGTIEVLVSRISRASLPEFGALVDAVHDNRSVALATVIEHPDATQVGTHRVIWPDTTEFQVATGTREFVHTFQPPPRMLVFGAIDFARATAQLGAFLGYRVTVCDARPVFATSARFPEADEVVVDWPHRYLAAEVAAGRVDARTVVAVLTHDAKFDVPVLEIALRADLGYVGAMGSRRTHDDRLTRLRAAGLTEDELATLSSPIGLDLGARTPEETAVSIAAEIIALQTDRAGLRLTHTAGPLHDRTTNAERPRCA
ncbi:XdhC family protein [Lentzea sp. NPDC004789]